jgi:hypothetical protein
MIHLASAEAELAKQITDEIKDHIKVKPDVHTMWWWSI